jgi:hypothetical protein
MALKFAVNNSLSAITSLPSGISGGALNLISTQTASASASLEFSLDDSYDSYVFKFINIHLANNTPFSFQGSTDGGSSYGVTITSTNFFSRHSENDATTGLSYSGANDLAQSTSFQRLATDQGTDNDQNMSGYLQIYNPSSTTFVKHFIARTQSAQASDFSMERYVAGYFNSTSAINSIQFKAESGNIDDGIIKMYGVS